MTKHLQLRVFAFTTACSLTVGAFVACAIVIASEPSDAASVLLSPSGLAGLAALSIAASLPFSAMGGIVGGVVAVKAIRSSYVPQNRWDWIRRGCIWGLGLGACSAASYPGLGLIFGDSGAWVVLAIFAPIGAIAGAMSGALVGVYCHCAIERHSGRCT